MYKIQITKFLIFSISFLASVNQNSFLKPRMIRLISKMSFP